MAYSSRFDRDSDLGSSDTTPAVVLDRFERVAKENHTALIQVLKEGGNLVAKVSNNLFGIVVRDLQGKLLGSGLFSNLRSGISQMSVLLEPKSSASLSITPKEKVVDLDVLKYGVLELTCELGEEVILATLTSVGTPKQERRSTKTIVVNDQTVKRGKHALIFEAMDLAQADEGASREFVVL